jgi:hypothetical protein
MLRTSQISGQMVDVGRLTTQDVDSGKLAGGSA